MDVHPPHHPIATRRDFFLHLFTITCGLLIALSLEGLVEWTHHRELVREARVNIRQEIEANRKATTEDIRNVQEDETRFKTNLEQERALRDHPKTHHTLSSSFSWSSTSDAAWRTARDTGALAYMPYAEVQRYADLYGQQEIVNTQAIQLFRQQTEAVAPMLEEADADNPTREELTRLLHDSATVEIDLHTLAQLLQQLGDQYSTILKVH